MPVITSLKAARRPAGFVEVAVDDVEVGLIAEKDVNRLGLAAGLRIDEATLRELHGLVGLTEALRLANGFIGFRPRSTAEVRQRLRRAKIEPAVIDTAIETLVNQGLLDDKRFADLWVENRTAFKPRSSRMLETELRRKGVDRATVHDALEATAGIDETQLAIEAGRPRIRRLGAGDRLAFERSLSAFLARRGFGYEAIKPAVEALWQEVAAE